MKKIFLAVMIVCVMCSGSYAVSQDMSVYVRQDVFDAKMETLFKRLHSDMESLGTRLEGRINTLSQRIDSLERRIGSATTIRDIMMYIPLIILFAIIIMVYVTMFMDMLRERKNPFTTVEDVRRIVREIMAENNAKIRA